MGHRTTITPRMGFATDAIHAGQKPDPSTGAIITPIYQTSTYVQEGLGKHQGYEYARTENPTRSALEANLAALENGVGACAFASGMAAISAVLTFVKQGDRVVVTEDLYGGTYRLFERVLTQFGIRFSYVDTSRTEEVEKAMDNDVKLVFLETPTNPILRITDLRAVSDLAHRFDARVVVDNTFMSPYFQRPLELGADLVLHSTTKYLNGHSDSIGGVVVGARQRTSSISGSFRTPRAPFSHLSILGCCFGARKLSPCAWNVTTRTPLRWQRFSPNIPRSRSSTTPDSQTILATTLQRSR